MQDGLLAGLLVSADASVEGLSGYALRSEATTASRRLSGSGNGREQARGQSRECYGQREVLLHGQQVPFVGGIVPVLVRPSR